MPAFARYIGIDYSGAQTPTASLKGLRVYMADRSSSPVEVMPPAGPRKYWTRRGVAEWLVERLGEDAPALVGIHHGFSFPLCYFEKYGLKPDWPADQDNRALSLIAAGLGVALMPTLHNLADVRKIKVREFDAERIIELQWNADTVDERLKSRIAFATSYNWRRAPWSMRPRGAGRP